MGLELILSKADAALVRQYEDSPAREFVAAHPDYVRRNWHNATCEAEYTQEEETLP